MENNPFVVLDNFAKDFVNAVEHTLIKYYILKGTENMNDLSYDIGRDGKVTFSYTTEVHHPAGYHMVGSNGFCDFAAYSEWDELVPASVEWDCIQDVPWNHRDADTDSQCYKDFMELWNVVFFIPRKKFDLDYTPYRYVREVVEPAFEKIKKYW